MRVLRLKTLLCERCEEPFEHRVYAKIKKYCPRCKAMRLREIQRSHHLRYMTIRGKTIVPRGPKISECLKDQTALVMSPTIGTSPFRKCLIMEYDGHTYVRIFVERKAIKVRKELVYLTPDQQVSDTRLKTFHVLTIRKIKACINAAIRKAKKESPLTGASKSSSKQLLAGELLETIGHHIVADVATAAADQFQVSV